MLSFASSITQQFRRDLTIKNETTQMFNRSQTIQKKRHVNVNVETATKRITLKKIVFISKCFRK